MALYEDRKLNAFSAVYKDSNDPDNEGYRLTNDQWREVKALDGDYNAQITLAKQYDAANRERTDADEQAAETARNASTGEAHQDSERGGYR